MATTRKHRRQRDAPRPPSDEELLARAAAGDVGAFGHFYERQVRFVYGLAYRILADSDAAEEVTRDTFVQLWQTAPSFDPKGSTARTRTVILAHRRSVEAFRRLRSRGPDERRDLPPAQLPGLDGPLDQKSAASAKRSNYRCLGRLTVGQREAIVQAYFGGSTCAEIARSFDTSLSVIQGHIRHGLRGLRRCMKDSLI